MNASIAPGILLILLSIFLLTLERSVNLSGQSLAVTVFFTSLLSFYLAGQFKKNREFMLSYFFQIYYFSFVLVSAALVSSGSYMIEIGKRGDPNGTFWVLAIFFITGLEVSRFAYYCSIKTFERLPSPRINVKLEGCILFAVIFLAMVFSFYVFVNYSSPYILKIERNDFWTDVVPSSFDFVPSLVFQTFFLALSLYWIKDKGSKVLAFLVVFGYLFAIIVVVGQKMSFSIIYATILGFYLAGHHPNLKITWRVILLSGVAIFSVFALVVYSYLIIGRDAGFIVTRVALQSQLNWSVLNVSDFPWFSTVPVSCYTGCGKFESGKDFISHYYLPTSLYNFYKESGTGLSGFFPALPLLTLGFPLAFLCYVVVSFCMGVLQAYLVVQIRRKNVIFSFLLFKIHFGIILFVYADNQSVYNKPFWLSILLCLSMFFLLSCFGKNRRSSTLI